MYKEKGLLMGNKNGLESSMIPRSLEVILKVEA